MSDTNEHTNGERRTALRKALQETRTVEQAAPILRGLVGEVMPSAVSGFDRDIADARVLEPEAGLGRIERSLRALEHNAEAAGLDEAVTLLNEARYALTWSPGLHGECERNEPCAVPGRAAHCRHEPFRQLLREAKRHEWSALEVRKEGGGLRHYLDDRPVHCGTPLELQGRETRYDKDDNGYTYPLPSGTIVRYEASQDGRTINVTLYVDVAGHEGVVSYHDGLRFRWPQREGR